MLYGQSDNLGNVLIDFVVKSYLGRLRPDSCMVVKYAAISISILTKRLETVPDTLAY